MSDCSQQEASLLPPLSRVIAIVGCDGTGKSTLSADVLKNLKSRGPAVRRYLGLVSGETGDKIKSLPFIGVRLERNLAKKATRAQDMKKKLPGVATSIIMYLLSLWRAVHLIKVMRLSRRGVWVISDRYPQAEIPGFHYDGPGLTASRTNNGLVSWLAAKEQKLYDWMAKYRPTLLIRLNIDEQTAFSRKPDHDLLELRDKIEVMPKLNFNGTHILEIDATKPFAEVLEAALDEIDKFYPQPVN